MYIYIFIYIYIYIITCNYFQLLALAPSWYNTDREGAEDQRTADIQISLNFPLHILNYWTDPTKHQLPQL